MLSSKRMFVGIAIMVIGIIIFITKMLDITEANHVDNKLLLIGGYGETISVQPQQEVILTYSSEVVNNSKQSLTIHSVEPILSAQVESLLIKSEKQQILIYDRVVKRKESLHVNGEIGLDTSQLTEEEINELLPGVAAYKITYNDGHETVFR